MGLVGKGGFKKIRELGEEGLWEGRGQVVFRYAGTLRLSPKRRRSIFSAVLPLRHRHPSAPLNFPILT